MSERTNVKKCYHCGHEGIWDWRGELRRERYHFEEPAYVCRDAEACLERIRQQHLAVGKCRYCGHEGACGRMGELCREPDNHAGPAYYVCRDAKACGERIRQQNLRAPSTRRDA